MVGRQLETDRPVVNAARQSRRQFLQRTAALAALAPWGAQAQGLSGRPVRIIVPFTAGALGLTSLQDSLRQSFRQNGTSLSWWRIGPVRRERLVRMRWQRRYPMATRCWWARLRSSACRTCIRSSRTM
ncbi:MAG: twin-arginine translocation signal domain-containing protein [Betaproteobacteria bacterium]|nr:twin-arginine translocation signal domain-containing protein [Betaproteobacteria bacterium]